LSTLVGIERLKHKKAIECLFSKGKIINHYPLRVVWQWNEQIQPSALQVMFVVPKKKFRRANKRNYIRRVMKEVFRENKHLIHTSLENSDRKVQMAILFLGQDMPDFSFIKSKMEEILVDCSRYLSK
jgi:ribonuclease P protein component